MIGIFEAIMLILGYAVMGIIGVMLLGMLFDGAQKRVHNNNKKFNND
jgi:uncharacterized membrane protein YuzA (DUF378 family)